MFTVQVNLTRPSEPAILDCSDVLTTPSPVSVAVIEVPDVAVTSIKCDQRHRKNPYEAHRGRREGLTLANDHAVNQVQASLGRGCQVKVVGGHDHGGAPGCGNFAQGLGYRPGGGGIEFSCRLVGKHHFRWS